VFIRRDLLDTPKGHDWPLITLISVFSPPCREYGSWVSLNSCSLLVVYKRAAPSTEHWFSGANYRVWALVSTLMVSAKPLSDGSCLGFFQRQCQLAKHINLLMGWIIMMRNDAKTQKVAPIIIPLTGCVKCIDISYGIYASLDLPIPLPPGNLCGLCNGTACQCTELRICSTSQVHTLYVSTSYRAISFSG
jgi:hypothetical protein